MRLYLVQHGTALPKDEDPERPLSENGHADVSRIASFLARSRLPLTRVLHSGKLRARQTAQHFADVAGPDCVIEQCAAPIAPNDSIEDLLTAVESWPEDAAGGDVMVVGHLPFMSKMVSRLVSGQEDNVVVHFQPGTVVALERGENGGGWSVAWVVRPELLGG